MHIMYIYILLFPWASREHMSKLITTNPPQKNRGPGGQGRITEPCCKTRSLDHWILMDFE